jgi:hypothetical protein
VDQITLWFVGKTEPALERTRFVSTDLHDEVGRPRTAPQTAGPGDFQWRAGPQSLVLFLVRAALWYRFIPAAERQQPCRFTGRFAASLYEALRRPDRLGDVAWPVAIFGYDRGRQPLILRHIEVAKPTGRPTVELNKDRLSPDHILLFWDGQDVSADLGQLATLARVLAESYFPDDAEAVPSPPGSVAATWLGGQPATRVFVSHSSQDRGFVEREVIGLLQGYGIGTWYSHTDITAADQWERSILKGLEDCDWFLVVMSPRSAASEWVRDEVHWAMNHRSGRVIPMLIEGCDPLAFHVRMSRIEHIDFRTDREAARQRLLSVLCPRKEEFPKPAGAPVVAPEPTAGNPFVWRGGITEAAAFFNRDREERTVREFLRKRQSCQLVGPRRIGKTSLLRQVQRLAPVSEPSIVVAYLDLQHPGCATLSGWLRRVAKAFGWSTRPGDLVEFAESLERWWTRGRSRCCAWTSSRSSPFGQRSSDVNSS